MPAGAGSRSSMTGQGAVASSAGATEEFELPVVWFGGVDGFLFGGGKLDGVDGEGMIDTFGPDVRDPPG